MVELLTRFSVEERFSWAVRRETKRQEDEAYSLLGIFNIHMSLRYGEGREEAYERLRTKIGKSLKRKRDSYAETVPFSQLNNAASSTIGKLSIARGAAFDPQQDEIDAQCHTSTCVDLLQQIYH